MADDFLTTYAPLANDISGQTGLNPATVLGIIDTETGHGVHVLGNNIFGISPSGPRGQYVATYPDVQTASQAFVSLMQTPRYAPAATVTDPAVQAQLLVKGGYNTANPKYASVVAANAQNAVKQLGYQDGGGGPQNGASVNVTSSQPAQDYSGQPASAPPPASAAPDYNTPAPAAPAQPPASAPAPAPPTGAVKGAAESDADFLQRTGAAVSGAKQGDPDADFLKRTGAAPATTAGTSSIDAQPSAGDMFSSATTGEADIPPAMMKAGSVGDVANALQPAVNALQPAPNTTYGSILPLARDDKTGEIRLAMPSLPRELMLGAVQGVQGVLSGDVGAQTTVDAAGRFHYGMTPGANLLLGAGATPLRFSGAHPLEFVPPSGTVDARPPIPPDAAANLLSPAAKARVAEITTADTSTPTMVVRPPGGGTSEPTHTYASADHDYPVTPTGVEYSHTDGRVYAQVRNTDGSTSIVPKDQLVPNGAPQTAAPQPAATGGPAPNLPPVPDGYVRLYHGGADPTSGGARWVTPDYAYARDYRPGQPVSYVDVPKDNPAVQAAVASHPDEPMRVASFNAPEDIAAQLRPVAQPAVTGRAPSSPTGIPPPPPVAAQPAAAPSPVLSPSDIQWAGGMRDRLAEIAQENREAGIPGSVGAAATPEQLATLTPAQMKAYRAQAELGDILAPPVRGMDNSIYVHGSEPTLAEYSGDPAISQKETLYRERAPNDYNPRLDQNNQARVDSYENQMGTQPQLDDVRTAKAAAAERDGAAYMEAAGPLDMRPQEAWLNKKMADPRIQQSPDRMKVLGQLKDALYDQKGNLLTDPGSGWGIHDNLIDRLDKQGDRTSSERYATKLLTEYKKIVDGVNNAASGGAFQTFLDNQSAHARQINSMEELQKYRPRLTNQPGKINAVAFHKFVADLAARRARPGVDPAMGISDDTMHAMINIDKDLKRMGNIDLGKARGSPTNLLGALAQSTGVGMAHLGVAALSHGNPAANLFLQGAMRQVHQATGNALLRRAARRGLAPPPGGYDYNPLTPPSAP